MSAARGPVLRGRGLRVRSGAATHVGRVREQNEDCLLADGIVFAVADGMGGHAAGEVASRLADLGKRVVVAGLDQDYLGRPFDPMPTLMALAEEVVKTRAICVLCGAPASRTQRLVASKERVVVGAAGMYEARCRRCFDPNVTEVDGTLPFPEETP